MKVHVIVCAIPHASGHLLLINKKSACLFGQILGGSIECVKTCNTGPNDNKTISHSDLTMHLIALRGILVNHVSPLAASYPLISSLCLCISF